MYADLQSVWITTSGPTVREKSTVSSIGITNPNERYAVCAARKLVHFKFCLDLRAGCGDLVAGFELVARWLLAGCCVDIFTFLQNYIF